jgi:hypothetical protein
VRKLTSPEAVSYFNNSFAVPFRAPFPAFFATADTVSFSFLIAFLAFIALRVDVFLLCSTWGSSSLYLSGALLFPDHVLGLTPFWVREVPTFATFLLCEVAT